MRLFKKILLGLAIALAVLLVAAATLLPRHWSVSREIVVNAEPRAIYPWVADIENWKQWNAFSVNDPDIVHTYPGEVSGVGAEDHWKSKKFGDGSAVITQADTTTGVAFNLYFGEHGENPTTPGLIAFAPADGGTTVTYSVRGDYGYNPFYRIMGLFMGGFMSTFFDQSLANLKRLAETNPLAPAPDSVPAPADTLFTP